MNIFNFMSSKLLYSAIELVKFYLKAQTKFNVQSPFLHDFVTNCLDTSKNYYFFDTIEKERTKFLRSKKEINILDFGAGSKYGNTTKKEISKIANSALSSKNQCQILFNICHYFKCQNILEMGTSLGISTAYIAAANSKTSIYTLEGSPEIAKEAQQLFMSLKLSNIEILIGEFKNTLPTILSKVELINLAFIDGHHAYKPTLEYFEMILPFCNDETILIFDDIYWSKEMTFAWSAIQNHPKTTLCLDLFYMGIVFLNPSLSKENMKLIPYIYKPWKIGIFG